MRIETDEWLPLAEAARQASLSLSTAHRLAKSLGIVREFFGVRVVRRKDIQTMTENRKPIGNPDWIESHEAAAEAAVKAVKSRLRRVKRVGMTEAEKRRNSGLSGAAKRDDA